MFYDFSAFHPDCATKEIVASGGKVYVVCTVCGVMAEVEGISHKVSAGDAFKVGNSHKDKSINRETKGKISQGVE